MSKTDKTKRNNGVEIEAIMAPTMRLKNAAYRCETDAK